MLSYLLMPVLIKCIGGSGLSWYPVYLPISIGGGHPHTTHIVPQPVIHTKVIVLDQHRNSVRSNLKLETNSKDANQNFHDAKINTHQDYLDSMHEGYWNGSPERFKYSLPVEESSWKPIREHIPLRYFPLKYIGEDGSKISQVVRQALKDSDARETRTNIILPVGIKKLHNPQLRRPEAKYASYTNGKVDSRHVGKPQVLRYPPAWRSKYRSEDLPLYKTDIRCHCYIPHH